MFKLDSKKHLRAAGLILLTGLVLVACKNDDDEEFECKTSSNLCEVVPNIGTPYELEVPYFFSDPSLPSFNPLTEEGIALGKHLFWEKSLSRNNTVSCGSCHFPEGSFADNAAVSTGLYGETGNRSSMPLINMAWNTSFFWDGRSATLEDQIIQPLINPIEMDFTWAEAVERIGQDSVYQEMFTDAFGTPCVDSLRMSFAMAQFIRTMISGQSKFDKARYFGGASLTPSEIRGMELFLAEGGDPEVFPGGQNGGDCFHCHGGALVEFTDHHFHNNGLDSVFTDDLGREEFSGLIYDRGLFRTPTLRNIALTAPYMHDGRFETLHEVVEHYNSGGHDSPSLDPLIKFPGEGLGLSPQDVDDLVNFLETLSDQEFTENESFHDPH